jgi:hypothetical protein
MQGNNIASMPQGNNTFLLRRTGARPHACNMTAMLYRHIASLHGCGMVMQQNKLFFN